MMTKLFHLSLEMSAQAGAARVTEPALVDMESAARVSCRKGIIKKTYSQYINNLDPYVSNYLNLFSHARMRIDNKPGKNNRQILRRQFKVEKWDKALYFTVSFHFVPGHFVPGHVVAWSFRPLVVFVLSHFVPKCRVAVFYSTFLVLCLLYSTCKDLDSNLSFPSI
jgi:hypothetical protein